MELAVYHHLKSDIHQGSYVTTEEPVSKGVGKPCQKPYLTRTDYLSVLLMAFCFTLAISSVQNIRIAAYLGQTRQLVLLGLTLSIISFTVTKQSQLLFITLEARFGGSLLQNYDAILRNNTFDTDTGPLLRLALIALYLLPLVLSASYKTFVGGSTTIPFSIPRTPQLRFGPAGPPGLYLGNGIAGFVNATSPLYNDHPQARTQPPQFSSSYGFAMHVINSTHTVMLDSPISSQLGGLQASLGDGEVQRLSATVNATYSSVNSTNKSPERADPAFWNNTAAYLGTSLDYIFQNSWGNGTWFGMWNGNTDLSLVFMSYWNESLGQSLWSQANGFNLYRGSCKATWVISSSSIFLEDASDFTTTWSLDSPHPQFVESATGPDCISPAGTDASQAIIQCNWNPLGFIYDAAIAEYLVPSLRTWNGADQLSVWAALIAAAEWARLATYTSPEGQWANTTDNLADLSESFPYLLYNRPYEMTSTVVTMKRSAGLFAVLSVLPLLLILILSVRILFYTTPVSNNFGITTLLAGAERSSLDVLDGASFSGKLTRKVRVQILVHDEDAVHDSGFQNVKYVFDSVASNSLLYRQSTGLRRSATVGGGNYE
jgi:hypothetical protein